jgi:tRNA threonylcarbamoyl adenosine modification protein YeaZ
VNSPAREVPVRSLSIDTSTLTSSVALVDDRTLLGERAQRGAGSHAALLIELIHAVLRDARVETSQLDALVVGLGPGSFTGVRVGVSVAKGLGLALERPVFGACSLSALASGARGGTAPVAAVLDARRGEVFFALFRDEPDGTRRALIPPSCATPERAGALLGDALFSEPAATLIGDLDEALRARVTHEIVRAAPSLALAQTPMATPSARWIAEELRTQRAVPDEGSMEPRYVRPMDAKLPAIPQAGR